MIEQAIVITEIRYRGKVIPVGSKIKVDTAQAIALWQDDHLEIYPNEYRLIYLN